MGPGGVEVVACPLCRAFPLCDALQKKAVKCVLCLASAFSKGPGGHSTLRGPWRRCNPCFEPGGSIAESRGSYPTPSFLVLMLICPFPKSSFAFDKGPPFASSPSHGALDGNHIQLLSVFGATIREALPWNAPSNHKLYMLAHSMTSLIRKRHFEDRFVTRYRGDDPPPPPSRKFYSSGQS